MLSDMPNLAHPLFSAPAGAVDTDIVRSFLALGLEEICTVDSERNIEDTHATPATRQAYRKETPTSSSARRPPGLCVQSWDVRLVDVPAASGRRGRTRIVLSDISGHKVDDAQKTVALLREHQVADACPSHLHVH